jgi:outer membrane protein OmpA-like peptidoglycan-associated protein
VLTRVALVALGLLCSACGSAYQRAYDKEMGTLEQQQQRVNAQQQTEYQEASKYAAVIYFPIGSAVVDSDGIRQLTWFVDKMQPYPQANFLVQGFADSTGAEANNQQLSVQRAQAVAQVLDSLEIAPGRMTVQGFGTTSAAASNATAQGRRDNRRVEVTLR